MGQKFITSRPINWIINDRRPGALLCVLGASSVYLLTMARTVQGFDSAEMTMGAFTLGFVHPPGYPLYMLLGHLFAQVPVGNVGFRLNLMSVVFGALTTSMLYKLLFAQTRDGLASFVCTFLFATAPVFWSQTLRAEVYTLHTFLIVSTLLAWFYAHRHGQVYLYVVCFILLGVGMGNHLTTALLWGSILICAIWDSPRWQKISAGATLLGLALATAIYLYFPWRSSSELQVDYIRSYFDVDMGSLNGLWWLISAQVFQHAFHFPDMPTLLQEIFHWGVWMWDNLLGIGLILGGWGWRRVRQKFPLWNRLLTVYSLINLVAFISYRVIDKEVMFIPMIATVIVWMAHGIGGFVNWITLRLQTPGHRRINALVNSMLLLVIAIGMGLNWPTMDLSQNRRVYDFATHLLDKVEPSTMIVNYWITASAVDYLQIVEGRRPDVISFNLDFYNLALHTQSDTRDNASARQQIWFAWLKNQLRQRPLCFIEPLPAVPDDLRWVQQSVCWKLVPEG